MIDKLRKKRRIDSLPEDVRLRKHRLGRWIYLSLLICFFVWIGDLFIGPLLRLQAHGLVVADRISVAVPFPAQIVDMAVDPGATVRAGDVLARVNSVELTQNIASLTARNAELLIKRVDIERRARVAEAVMPIARDRAGQAETAFETIRDIRKRGDISLAVWTQALQERFVSSERVAELTTEVQMATASVSAADAAIGDSLAALEELRLAYNRGVVTAPEDGIVGLLTARPGDVLTLGQPILALYRSKSYVLAYLETGTLYSVSAGDRVRLSNGFTQATGRVAEVLPVADRLPEEFRNAFQPRGRSQVALITLPEDSTFPLFSKVSISGIGWLSRIIKREAPRHAARSRPGGGP
ncbi:MAG: HlyD family secretion protein [Rhodospirillales bacterium]